MSGRRRYSGLAVPRRIGRLRSRLAPSDARQPLPRHHGPRLLHSCEDACNRGKLDEAVGINSVERFLGDEAIKLGWQFAAPKQESGKKVLIVGAGPSGM